MKTGYARVSSYGQSLEVQRQKLQEEGCAEIFEEKASAVSGKRNELESALRILREGDVLVVTKLDRLARSMQDLLAITNVSKERAEPSLTSHRHRHIGRPLDVQHYRLLRSLRTTSKRANGRHPNRDKE
jgi:hypothetical protein